jgi:nucleoside-diphosphate-sugar epimerase
MWYDIIMKIHVTGANGFLAKHVIEACRDLGDIQGTDVDSMDITNSENVLSVLEKNVPDVIIHLAALQGRAVSREKPADFFKVNTWGTLNLIEACRKLGIKKFVLMSSITVHGKSKVPIDENALVAPIHPYGASKAAAEAIVKAYSISFGIDAFILRPNFIAGRVPDSYTENLIYNFIKNLDENNVIELAGDGHFSREWVHPKDVADAIRQCILSDMKGCEAFILSEPSNRLSMMELAERLVSKVGKGYVTTNPKMEGFSLISSNQKAREKLNWSPQISIDNIIEEIWNGYKSESR